jgi:anti-sigma regulatory factor (Ser/Thr protein kinase)
MAVESEMPTAADIELRTTSRSENVAMVRELLDGVADGLSLPPPLRDEIKTAVSEACNNVILHAYEGSEGPMELDATVHEGHLEVVVRDHGGGIQPRLDASGEMHGVGLAVIQAFTDSVELRGTVGHGTEVRMEFLCPDLPAAPGVSTATGPSAQLLPRPGDAVVSLAPGPMLGPALAHLAAALAVRARFSVDRLADAQLVADALSAHAPAVSSSGRVIVSFLTGPRSLEMQVGPLREGAGEQLLQDSGAPGLGPVIVRLTNDVAVVASPAGELLVVSMSDPR